MVIGWYFGPVTGFFAGAFTDTIGWILRPSTWFWMYAIQEPSSWCDVGVLGSIATLRKMQFVQLLI